ncbi:hypothetical protein RHGRI_011267 [Rhododendron griersonianum]|uniref:Uncharacterized protein n=1 Tax=Rhododendron griersonianum TaxID=479676 RepID=A0AAV6KLN3_9ERIC|nr:hypothetical protein RHGRI_011267 [Rhododendron griersonianum]
MKLQVLGVMKDGVLDLRGHGQRSLPVEEFGVCFACTFDFTRLGFIFTYILL